MASKTWFGPMAVVAAVVVAAAAVKAMSSIQEGQFAQAQANAQGQMYKDAASQAQLEELRAHDDLTIRRDRSLSNSKAILAAQGGGVDDNLIAAQAAQFGDQDSRVTHDSALKQRNYYARANYAYASGSNSARAGYMQGAGQMLGGIAQAASLYSGGGKA